MLAQLTQHYAEEIQNIYALIMLINAAIHLAFAGAVARDASSLNKLGQRPALVSATTWAFATLIGGILTATVYWFIHHSTLTRSKAL